MTNEELRQSLLAAPKNGFARITPEQKAQMEEYCKGYMAFLDACKTEREATTWTIAEAQKRGFRPLMPGMAANPGDKIYFNNRDKSGRAALVCRCQYLRCPCGQPPDGSEAQPAV